MRGEIGREQDGYSRYRNQDQVHLTSVGTNTSTSHCSLPLFNGKKQELLR